MDENEKLPSMKVNRMDMQSALLITEAMGHSGNKPPVAITLLLRSALELTLMAPPSHFDKVCELWDSARSTIEKKRDYYRSVRESSPDQ